MIDTSTSTDKRLERVRKLLALAENPGATPEEAEAFTAKAATLIAKYGIDETLIAAAAPDQTGVEKRVMVMHAPYARSKSTLAYTVAVALGCKGVVTPGTDRGRKIDRLHLFGKKGDMTRVDVIVTSLLMQAARDVNRVSIPPFEDKAAYRRSWWMGFTSTIDQRLKEAERMARESNESRFEDAGTSSALVLRNNRQEIAAAVSEEFPNTRFTTSRTSGTGHGAGAAAGSRANLGAKSFGGRAAIGTGR